MSGWVDLHCHYLPGIDDGVRTADEGLRVLGGLFDLGWSQVIATPHIRTAMFDNRAPGLRRAFDELAAIAAGAARMPARRPAGAAMWGGVVWGVIVRGEALPYPGGRAALIEFHYEAWPRNVERRLFEMMVRGVRPVIAHPERYAALFRETEPLDPLLDVGALTLLDLMSLVGRYGERPRRAAERMLEEGAYDAACTDAHRPDDVAIVARSVERLRELVGGEEAELLLGTHPRAILAGTYEP